VRSTPTLALLPTLNPTVRGFPPRKLKMKDPDRKLYLAIPEIAYETFFQKDFPRLVIQEYKLDLIIYDVANEEIIQWLP
jgi:hypothetical protein